MGPTKLMTKALTAVMLKVEHKIMSATNEIMTTTMIRYYNDDMMLSGGKDGATVLY